MAVSEETVARAPPSAPRLWRRPQAQRAQRGKSGQGPLWAQATQGRPRGGPSNPGAAQAAPRGGSIGHQGAAHRGAKGGAQGGPGTRGPPGPLEGGPLEGGPLEGAARGGFPRAGGGCSAVHSMTRDGDGAGAGAAPHVSCWVCNGIVVLPESVSACDPERPSSALRVALHYVVVLSSRFMAG